MNGKNKPIIIGIGLIIAIFFIVTFINRFFNYGDNELDIIKPEETTEGIIEETSSETTVEQETVEIFDGYKKYQYDNGDVYDGDWKDDTYDGKGTLTQVEIGRTYDGEWKQGAFYKGNIVCKTNNYGGTATIEYNSDSGEKIENGHFVRIFDNGDIYDGEWFDGKKSGQGTLYMTNEKKIMQGYWDEDHLVTGKMITRYEDGFQTYELEIKEGLYNGKGLLYNEKGQVTKTETWINDECME